MLILYIHNDVVNTTVFLSEAIKHRYLALCQIFFIIIYILNEKDHPEFFNRRTIYDDLINKLQKLQLVEPLDLRIKNKYIG
jgi:hypothetical protein